NFLTNNISNGINKEDKEVIGQLERITSQSIPDSYENNNSLDKTTIVLSNSCNLRCKYCYVDGGNYNQNIEDEFMTSETIQKITDYVHNVYGGTKRVAYFGGEPLLNFKVLKDHVLYYKKLVEEDRVEKLPTFSITTNGTIYSDEIFSFLNQHNFVVGISIDGNKSLHDELRKDCFNKGSYDKIIANINKIRRKFPELKLIYEATYTNLHQKRGFSIDRLRKIIVEQTSISDGVIVPVMENKANINKDLYFTDLTVLYNILLEESEKIWGSYTCGEPIFDQEIADFLRTFKKRIKSPMICNMGKSFVTVTSNGDLYPCQTLLNNQEMIIGNIFENKKTNQEKLNSFYTKFRKINKFKNPECQKCIAINLCMGCPARWYYEKNTTAPWPLFCKSVKEQVKNNLTRIIEIRNSPQKWQKFKESLDNIKKNKTLCEY
ncbi:MAG TPA: radical SAM protein, partial [Bacteroidales bacterium]|nr:radical SAM protein [Bacteroidales bacterium]